MDDNPPPNPPRYPGEDTRSTSRKELAGWYSYGWAAEVFVVCGIGSFVPITLEQLAREQGVLLSDRKTPCKTNLPQPQPPTFNGTSISDHSLSKHQGQCIIYLLGTEVNTASFALYVFSFSVLIQALLIISMSGAADHGRFRKTLLLSFAFIGSVASMLFLPITSKVYYLGALLAIVANTCVGASFVLLNSFLPLLVRHHPDLHSSAPKVAEFDDTAVVVTEDTDCETYEADSQSALLGPSAAKTTQSKQRKTSPALRISTKISSNGIGIGYLAAVVVQVISAFIVYTLRGSTFSLRLVLFFVGLWWFVFSLPGLLWLRPRPGPPIKKQSRHPTLSYIVYGWTAIGKTLMRARRLRDLLTFLVAWFFLSDAIATVSGTAILFAKTSLGMAPASLALINVVVMLSGVAGALMWSTVSRWFDLKPSQTILACIYLFELIPFYALLGYIPAIKRLGVFGLQQPWEMYPVGLVYGIVIAGISSYCRSLFGELVPPGFEASYFALYAITDKGSSIFGPLVVGAITDATGDIRPAFWFLAVLIGLPIPLMYLVDVDRGKLDAAAMVKELEGEEEARAAEGEAASEGFR